MILLRKISFWLALAGILATAQLVRVLRAEYAEPLPAAPVPPPEKPSGASSIGAAGLVEALQENTLLGVPVPGLVTAVFVAPWDRVEAGQPLLQLDDRELRAQLPVREADVAVAGARLQQLQTRATRIAQLQAKGAAPEADLDDIREETAVSQAQLAAAEAAVTQTRTLLERLTVRAPRAGTVLRINVRPGEYVAAGSATPPFILGDTTRLQVRADVDEQLAPRVVAGRSATGYIKGDSTRPLTLTFVRIEPVIVPKVSLTGASSERVDTRVLQVIFELPANLDRPIYVGQQIDLYINES